MSESEPAGGNIVIYSKVRNPEARARLQQLLDDLPGERVNAAVYEVDAADWDDGLWEEEFDRMQEIIDPDMDVLYFWQVIGDRLVRTCLAGRHK
jgi:hypothetical protein